MNANLQQQTVFHLTGRRPAEMLEQVAGLKLRPALVSRYRDLTRLRYDFPVVLVGGAASQPFVRSLSEIVNTFLRANAAKGPDGEGLRKHILRVEREVRRDLARGGRGQLSELWNRSARRLAEHADESLAEVLRHSGSSLGVDGTVLDCDENMPAALLEHAWRRVQDARTKRVRSDLNGLIVRLNDILRADFANSEAGRTAESLSRSVGARQAGLFDFKMMSRLLALGSPSRHMPDSRRARIEWALSVMRSQRFFATVAATGETVEPCSFVFDSCRSVLEEYPKRLPMMAELVKAMSIAELEIDGRYDEATHDPLFEGRYEDSLGPQDLAIFPDYLVRLKRREKSVAADAPLMELLSSGIPAKVLVQVDDILEEASVGQGRFPFGTRSVQLASTAIGLTDTFVLQSSSSNLLQLRDRIRAGMEHAGSALFSIFSGTAAGGEGLPTYLVSAAAMQSRAFPAFTYDPGAGADLASRFCLEDNPQSEATWPVTDFEYADADLQRVPESLAFTLADFIACDPRYEKHFARVSRAAWNDAMVPVADWLAREPDQLGNEVPYLLAVDESNVLHRVIVDDKIIQAARRCGDNWRRLQELGGINNSYAVRLLAREKAVWEEARQKEIAALTGAAAQPAAAAAPVTGAAEPAPAAAVPAPVAEEPARSPDEPYIETLRCSSCNECTTINNKMFAYNENQQAYIADLSAGTYRQMVEAAESCQLAIIHPGKPKNPKETGLEDLMQRAAVFG